jgi:predicted acylesterase/phospholipase RssA
VPLQEWQLADGGVIDSLATHVAIQQGADKIIAVDVYPSLDSENPWNDPLNAIMGLQFPGNLLNGNGSNGKAQGPNMFSSMWRSVRIRTWHLHQKRLDDYPPDILMRPNVDHYGSLDFKDLSGPIEAGLSEANRHLEALRALKKLCQPLPAAQT